MSYDYVWITHRGSRIRVPLRVRAREGSAGGEPRRPKTPSLEELTRRQEMLRDQISAINAQLEKDQEIVTVSSSRTAIRDLKRKKLLRGYEEFKNIMAEPKRLRYGIIEAHWYLKNLDNWHVHQTFDIEDHGMGFIPFVPDLAGDLGVKTLVKMRSGPWSNFKKSKYPRINHPLHDLVLYAGRSAFTALKPRHLEAYFSQRIKTRVAVTVADAFRIRHDLPPIHETVETPVVMSEEDIQKIVDEYIDEGELATSIDFVKPDHKNLVSTTPVESDVTLREFMGTTLEKHIIEMVMRIQEDDHCDMVVVALVNDTLLKKFGGPIQIDPPV